MNCRTSCSKTILFVFVLLVMAVVVFQATPVSAGGICSTQTSGSCLQNESCQAGVTQKLNCTANDVRVAKVVNTRDTSGNPINSCVAGQTGINFVADFLVQTTATSTRSNIGLYFSNFDVTQQPDALNGSCTDNVISPPHKSSGVTACLGSGAYKDLNCTGFGTYDELDTTEPKHDAASGLATGCGDTTSQDGTVCLGPPDALGNAAAVACPAPAGGSTFTATQVVTVEIKNFTCPNVAAGTQVQLPNCTSWQIPGGTIACSVSPPDYPYPTSPPTAIEGTPSKCNCGVISLPIIVQTPSIQVQKACTSDITTGPLSIDPVAVTQSPTSCDAGAEGAGAVTYTVELTNTSNTGGFTVDQICDDRFGRIYRSGSAPASLAECAAGSTYLGNGSNNCAGSYDLAANASTSCTFISTPNLENLPSVNPTFTDTITAFGHGDIASSTEVSGTSNTVSVFSSDAPSTAKTTPTPTSTPNICVTERYTAVVQNTSGTDEDIFLSGIADNGHNLTVLDSEIVGTTCGQTAGAGHFGLGTLNTTTVTSSNGGAFGAPPGIKLPFATDAQHTNGGSYTCLFDVLMCGAPATVQEFGSGTGTCDTSTHACSAGLLAPGLSSCNQNSDCDSTCTGISHTDTLSAALTGDDAPPETVSPVTNKTSSFTQCLQEPPFVTVK